MKKAKVVTKQTDRNKRFLTGKKAAWLTLGAVAALGTLSVVVPTSNIPGFKYIAQLVGLNADATRQLTMADFASYAIGRDNNKIEQLRAANLTSNSGGFGGGLSPFSTLVNDRLAQAYKDNAQEALAMEKALGGRVSPFDKAALDKEYTIDPASLTKGFDPSKLMDGSKAAYSGAMEALAAAAGKQAEAFGRPVKKEELQGIANLVGVRDSSISNIVGGSNILSFAKKDDSLYDSLSQRAKALMGTSIFGSVNPDFTRTDTRIGRPVYGIFKDLGNAFFFSRYAAGSKLPTAASDIAVAAFDGGSPQDQSIITKEEDPEAPSVSVNPEQELNFSANNYNMCGQVSQTYQDILNTISRSINGYLKTMLSLTKTERVRNQWTTVPGCCLPQLGWNNRTLTARNKWNYYLTGVRRGHMGDNVPEVEESLYSLCTKLRQYRNILAGNCGIVFEEPEYDCRQMEDMLFLGSCGYKLPGKCQNITIFGNYEIEINITRKKYKEYKRLYEYYISEAGGSLDEETANELASEQAGLTEEDLDGNVRTICTAETPCLAHINTVLEKTFAIEKIIDIRGIIMEQYAENQPQQLRNYDAHQLTYCHMAGDMSDCQDILDYYSQDMWEEQCRGTNWELNALINPATGQLRMSIDQVREKYGPVIADCLVIYLAINGHY